MRRRSLSTMQARPKRLIRFAAASVAGLLFLGGCGAGSKKSATTTSSTAVAAPESLPLSERVIRQGELPGFVPRRPVLVRSVAKWVGPATTSTRAEAAAWTARLRRDGFRLALRENLAPATGSDRAALSWVVEFRSAIAAKSQVGTSVRLARILNEKPGYSYKAFKVNGIPGARGLHDTHPGGAGDNILFSDGRFLYLVGDGWAAAAKSPPTRTHLLAAAMRLYRRVHAGR
jgi:hypothetical protein